MRLCSFNRVSAQPGSDLNTSEQPEAVRNWLNLCRFLAGGLSGVDAGTAGKPHKATAEGLVDRAERNPFISARFDPRLVETYMANHRPDREVLQGKPSSGFMQPLNRRPLLSIEECIFDDRIGR